ncbi:ParB/RepB/Spo0J family partition protein [Saccharopolyspora mangrovi]|uniref:ParB/Sulfiredoxin domain-containing protein n=1 Tax=Saccharopolyspora mangrovi TaxID=3082379 RepID=A0ABU6AII4_9PSEU|nr:hypothetical protein [Saccharopolyspora sp. S2-29]MEB3371298.1 hypothetical protein [Saccharopolyspora sp. S2-29]
MATTEKKLPYLDDLDPKDLVLRNNPRTISDLESEDPEMLASIGTHGVRFPVLATPTDDGPAVIDGFTRVLGALHHQQNQVPVLLVDEAEAAAWQRLVDQWIANEHRRGLGEADKAVMIEQMALYGFDSDDIAEQLTTDVTVVKAALKVRGSAKTTSLARQHDQLDMLQLAAISEFEDDEDAYTEIVDTLHHQPAQLGHVMARRRQERETRQARDAEIQRLTSAGVTVLDASELPEASRPLSALKDAQGEALGDKVEEHQSCPGHAASVRTIYTGEARVSWHCLAWKKHGHYPRSDASGPGGEQGLSEEQKAERARARKYHPQWRAALEERRSKLQELLQRKTPPKQARQFLASALAAGDERVAKAISRGNRYARTVLGDKRIDRLATGGRRMTEDQVTMLELGLVLCAYEEAYDAEHTVSTWRSPTAADQRYFAALESWGYTLSPVEQLVLNPDSGSSSSQAA